MASTLQQAVKALQGIEIEKSPRETGLAQKLCGKYKGAIPEGKTSTEFIREELRETLYGKIAGNT